MRSVAAPAATVGGVRRLRDTRLLDGLLAIAMATALQLHLQISDHVDAALVNVVGALGLTLPLAVRHRAPFAMAATFAATAVLNAIVGGGLFEGEPPPFPSLIAGAIVFYSLGAYAEDRPALIGACLGLAGLWGSAIVNGQVDQSLLFAAGLVFTPWLVGRSIRSRALRYALLEREQAARERIAVGEERARIARELHDVVAHSVGAMVVQAQGARRMLDRDPERAREALETIERTGRAALDDMRRSLGVLRRQGSDAPLAPQPGMDGLGALVEHARETGLGVELVIEGDPAPLPAGVDLSAYRIVQEALTNTLKHAGPVRTRVAVRYADGRVELEISDDGAPGRALNGAATTGAGGAAPAGAGGAAGQGLVGMRERVALYGGDLHAGRRPEGGFVVRASLPMTEATP
jgi:signal transduction histidine kinase